MEKDTLWCRSIRHFFVPVALLVLLPLSLCAQTETGGNGGDIHTHQLEQTRKALPFPNLRETDIVWQTQLWRTIDMHELFNQFFYFPIDNPDPSGKKSLAYVLWDAVVAGEIPIYEDDALEVPIDNELFVQQYTKADTIQLEIGYDEDDNEQYETIIRPREFDGAEILQYAVNEAWFLGKEETRRQVRCLALAPLKQSYHKFANTEEEIYLGLLPLFWVPMQNPVVRSLLVRYTAYVSENNVINQPSFDWVFISQYYQSYITKESNIYNRRITDYATGEDAVLEADLIEDKLADIENDMWDF